MKSGGVTCLSRNGCRPERLRLCVALDTLRCRTRESDSDPSNDQDEGSNEGDCKAIACSLIHYVTIQLRLLEAFYLSTICFLFVCFFVCFFGGDLLQIEDTLNKL